MSTAASRSIPTLAAFVIAAPLVFAAFPSTAQVHGYQPGRAGDFYGYRQGAVCGDRCGDRTYDRGYDRSYQGQVNRPGDYRCDAYWDRGRTDCDASWRDQRAPWQGGGGRRNTASYGGPAVYYGEYGRPDVVYSSGGYSDRYGQDAGRYGRASRTGRDPGRINWCLAEYRSYDPLTSYYIAYSGRAVFCG